MPASRGATDAAQAGAGQSIGAGLRGVHDLAKLMIVPAVGIVVGDDDRGAGPVGALLQEVDGVDDERLLVERIGVAGVSVLVAGRLQEADGGKVARGDGVEEVVSIVLVVAGIALLADGGDGGGTRVLRVGRGGVVLERLVVRNVVGLVRAGDRAKWCERWQPVVPLGLVMVRSKPPSKKPQLTPAVFSRSPMFLPPIWKTSPVVVEQTSPSGSASLMTV